MKTGTSFIAIAALLLFATCKKETKTEANTMKDFFSATRVQSQTFTVAPNWGQPIAGAKGTLIYIRPGSLLDLSGNTVTGNVNVELKEIYSKGDMILSNASTTSGNVLLKSGGEIYLNITKNAQQLRINPVFPLTVEFPATSSAPGMQLFYGGFVKNDTVAADSVLQWNIACNCTTATATVTMDSIGHADYYNSFFGVDSFGWTNCDRFWNLTGGTDPMIQLPQGFDNTNTGVYMIFDAENTVATADLYANQICRFHSGEHTPIGLNVTIVAIAKKGEQYYYDIAHEVTTSGATFNVTMSAASHDAIVAAIGAL